MKSWWVLVILSALLASGCIVNQPIDEEKLKEVYSIRPEIPKELLDRIGFEFCWENPLKKEITQVWMIDGVLFAFTRDYWLYKIRPETGEVLWCYDAKRQITQMPYVYRYPEDKGMKKEDDELILVMGDIIQIVSLGGGDLYSQIYATFPVASAAWASRTHIYAGSWDERVYAWRKNDIKANKPPVWQYSTAGDVSVRGEVRDPCVLVVSEDGKVYNLNAATGTHNWTFPTDGAIVAPPYLYRNHLYFGSVDTKCYSINAVDGQMDWAFHAEDQVERTPVAIGSTVYCTARNNYFSAINRANGKEMWRIRGGEKVLCRGVEKVYVLNDRKETVAIDNVTGQVLWKQDFHNVDFFVTNTDEKLPVIIFAFRNGWFFGIKEKEKM